MTDYKPSCACTKEQPREYDVRATLVAAEISIMIPQMMERYQMCEASAAHICLTLIAILCRAMSTTDEGLYDAKRHDRVCMTLGADAMRRHDEIEALDKSVGGRLQ